MDAQMHIETCRQKHLYVLENNILYLIFRNLDARFHQRTPLGYCVCVCVCVQDQFIRNNVLKHFKKYL